MKWSPTVAGAPCPRGAGRERPGEAGSAAPLNLELTVQRQRRDDRASVPCTRVARYPLAHGMSLSPRMLASHLIHP